MKIFDDKKACCGCGACGNVCPSGAVEMRYDEYGCAYPGIAQDKCVECGACTRVCPMKNKDNTNPAREAYVAAGGSEDILRSASGGIFYSIADEVIRSGGAAFGCAWSDSGDTLLPEMIMAEDSRRLRSLQGSKYAQADSGQCYRMVKDELNKGRTVVFSGTPCQVAALRNYLKKPFEKLYLIDIICHGVPGTEFFESYIKWYENKHGGRVGDIAFRDKINGWGLNGSVTALKNGKPEKRILYSRECSYYSYFLRCATYRESCYHCPYASQKRAGDITIGDYWGIEEEHPELLEKKLFDTGRGVSCVLVNTKKGGELLERFGGKLTMCPSEVSKVSAHNQQLNRPSEKHPDREAVMNSYREKGYSGVEECFSREKDLSWRYNWAKRRIKRLLKK